MVCEIQSEGADSGMLKAAVQPLPTHTYFCHFKSYLGQKKSVQTDVIHETVSIVNVHMSVRERINLMSDSEMKTSKKIAFSNFQL